MPPLTMLRSTHAAIPVLDTSPFADAHASPIQRLMQPETDPSTSKALASWSQPEIWPLIEPTPRSHLALPPSSNSPVEVYRANALPSSNLSATLALPSTSTTHGSASTTFRLPSNVTASLPLI